MSADSSLYLSPMIGWVRTRLGRVALFIALLALIAMLARGVMPFPALAHGQRDFALGVGVPDATLCLSKDGKTDPPPAGGSPCYHCPLCTFSVAAPLIASAHSIAPPPVRLEVLPSARTNTDARPRAPPGRANKPRAPPPVV
jgi:hypothetical protein